MENAIERRGRCCMVEDEKLILQELVSIELERQKKYLKRVDATERKKMKEEVGFDILEEQIEGLESLKKRLEAVPVCIGTKLGTIMQEEDYPKGKLGTWKRELYGANPD